MRQIYRKHYDLLHCIALTLLFSGILAIICICNPGCVYGSQTDWSNQHFAIPEYFRTRFYDTGNLFPDFAMHLGGGQNIFHFSYYGLYSPVILFSYFFPGVHMSTYIQIAHILLTLLSTILCYFWMKLWFSQPMSFLLAVLYLLAAPIIYHSHHHIMFTSYFPFLFWALFLVPRALQNHHSLALIFATVFILLTNFYLSIGAFFVIILYAVFYTLHRYQNHISLRMQLFHAIEIILFHLFFSLLIAAFFLLPTLFTLWNGRAPSQGTSLLNVLLPKLSTQYITYNPFSPGLTSTCVLSLLGLFMLPKKSYRFLCVVFSLLILFPLFLYLMNGTMYLDAKAFIPFLPILLLLYGFFFKELSRNTIPIKKTFLLFCVVIAGNVLLFQGTNYAHIALILDGVLMCIAFFLFFFRRSLSILLVPTLLCSTIVCLTVNLSDSYMKQSDVAIMYDEDIQKAVNDLTETDNHFYRISNEYQAGNTVNCIWGPQYYRSSVYSSIYNRYLSDFLFTQSQSENSIRNETMLVQSKNPFFSILMGEKYIISSKQLDRYGLQNIGKYGIFSVYKNNLAFPIGYATSNIMTQEQYQKQNSIQQLESLLNNAIVPADAVPTDITCSTFNSSDIKETTLQYTISPIDNSKATKIDDNYYIHSKTDFTVTVTLKNPIEDLLLLRFYVDNQLGDGSTTDDVSITINGIRNRLTDPSWKYQNHNNTFQYTISSQNPIQTLQVHFSAGDYMLSDVSAYTFPYEELTAAKSHLEPWQLRLDKLGDDTMEGDICVSNDGWFVLSMPYDNGFHITVDGQKTAYTHTNIDCIGFPISRGNHHICVTYEAPGFTTGKKISLLGIGLAVLWCSSNFWYKKKKINNNNCLTRHQ